MRSRSEMHNYQNHGVEHVLNNPYAFLAYEMGCGKSVTTLTAAEILMYDRFEVNKALVIAPKRVAMHTWPAEISEWEHLRHLTTSVCLGSQKERIAALKRKADIYTINRENVPWLVAYLKGGWPFDLTIIDESSSFKAHDSQRFKALKTVRPLMKRVVLLSGTPQPNSEQDLWSQIYLLDRGERLGKTIGQFRMNYFRPGASNGHVVYDYKLRGEQAKSEIHEKISDICISLKAKDWLELPERIDNYMKVEMPEGLQDKYADFEFKTVMKIGEEDISAVNAAGLRNKLLQFTNGAVYNDDKQYREVHDLKIEALGDILESANGKPVLVCYKYKSDVARIKQKLKAYKPQELEGAAAVDKWNRGEIPFLLIHPASAGHGLNMQHGGHHMVWFGLPDSLELYQQAVARLDRQGQQYPVINMILYVPGTFEDDVIKGLKRKAWGQEELMQAIKARISKFEKV